MAGNLLFRGNIITYFNNSISDVIGLAQTGSGKTGAFALPVLKALIEQPQYFIAVVLAPTRELAYQISETFEGLGAARGVHVVTIVGGMDLTAQAIALAKRPHIVVGTPGRIVHHLQNTKELVLHVLLLLFDSYFLGFFIEKRQVSRLGRSGPIALARL